MTDNDYEPSEVGLEISLTTYDEGFEDYLELEPEEEDDEVGDSRSRLDDDDDDESCCSFPDKPSTSKDSSQDGTASTTLNSFDEGHPNDDGKGDNAVDDAGTSTKSENNRPPLPPPPPPRPQQDVSSFLARLDNSRAYIKTFPKTVQHLEVRVTQLLEDLHAKAQQCQAVETKLALTQHEAYRQAEQVREFYDQVAADEAETAKQIAQLEREAKEKDARIAQLVEEQEATKKDHEEEVQKLEEALVNSREETSTKKLKSEQDIQQELESQRQELETGHRAQVATLTETLETERDTHRTAFKAQTESVEQLRADLREWKDRADHHTQEITRLTQDKANLVTEQTHMSDRIGRYQTQVAELYTELDEARTGLESARTRQMDLSTAQVDAQAKQTELETKLSKTQSQLETANNRIAELQQQSEAANAERDEYVQQVDRLEVNCAQKEEQRVALQRELDVQATEHASWKEKHAKLKTKYHEAVSQAEDLTATLHRMCMAHEQATDNAQQAQARIQALEQEKASLVADLAEARDRATKAETHAFDARREALEAKAKTHKLQDSAKRRRDILAQHRRI